MVASAHDTAESESWSGRRGLGLDAIDHDEAAAPTDTSATVSTPQTSATTTTMPGKPPNLPPRAPDPAPPNSGVGLGPRLIGDCTKKKGRRHYRRRCLDRLRYVSSSEVCRTAVEVRSKPLLRHVRSEVAFVVGSASAPESEPP